MQLTGLDRLVVERDMARVAVAVSALAALLIIGGSGFVMPCWGLVK